MVQLSLSSLRISHFRTHKLSVIEPTQEPIVIFGLNGAGKTNILEAISMFAPGQGFRRAKISDLSRRPELLGWKLTGKFNIFDQSYEIIISWDEALGRKIKIDGKSVTQSKLARLIRILWITPMMDRIWLNGSAERRRFLDRIASNLVPDHTENSVKYYKALKQRNKLLKDRVLDSNWYDAVENQMALSAIEINKGRGEAISSIMEMQKKSVSSFPAADLNLVGPQHLLVQDFQSVLFGSRKQDMHFGRTLIGPHLSDLGAIYSSKGIEAKNCSTGEQKALLISIIIATAKIQLEKFNVPPILLFDEVSAHLDIERRADLYAEICNLDLQIFMTGTDSIIFNGLEDRAKYYEIVMNMQESMCIPIEDPQFKNIQKQF